MIFPKKLLLFWQSPMGRMTAVCTVVGLLLASFVASGWRPAGVSWQTVFPVRQSFTDHIQDWIAEADGLKARGRLAEAIVVYEKVLQERPDITETYFRLGALYFSLGLKSKAEEFYLKAIERDFQEPELYFHLGYIKESEEKFQEALEWYLKAEEKGVASAELFYNIGNVFARLSNSDRAVEYYLKAVAVNPEHMDALINLSIIFTQQEKFADALTYLNKARDLGYSPPQEYLKELQKKILSE